MKYFIYQDTDQVNSILAQSNEGLVIEKSRNLETNESKTKSKEKGLNLESGAEINLHVLKAEIGSGENKTNNKTSSYEFASKEYEKILLDDYSYNLCESILKLKNMNESNNDLTIEIGSYVKFNKDFKINSLDFVMNLFKDKENFKIIKDNDLLKLVKNEQERQNLEIKKLQENMNRDQRRKIDKDNNRNKPNNQKLYDDLKAQFNLISSFIPKEQFLSIDNKYIFPLNTKYLRVNSENIGFNYGGPITCVGLVTNTLDGNYYNLEVNNITNLSDWKWTLYSILQAFFNFNNKFYIIQPLAIYYETNGNEN